MRQTGVGVVADFRLPPGAPEEVVTAQERYEHVANRYAEHLGRIQDAEEELKAAQAKDAQEAVHAAMEGGGISNVNRYERDARARVDALRRALGPLEQAVDEAGNAMLGPIAGAAESWATGLEEEAEEELARYRSAVQEALAALEEAERAYSAVDFLRSFHPADARMGHAPGWHGKPMPLAAADAYGREERAARELLALAANAAPRYSRDKVEARNSQAEAYEAGLQGDPREAISNEPVRP
jgi:hypothetical protein